MYVWRGVTYTYIHIHMYIHCTVTVTIQTVRIVTVCIVIIIANRFLCCTVYDAFIKERGGGGGGRDTNRTCYAMCAGVYTIAHVLRKTP